jgi:ATP-dependent RNA helicase SUPV3L1/SUV3
MRAMSASSPAPKAILGPTNTGKTTFAIERMLAHGTGMIGLPLRLLAREVYDRVVKRKARRRCALVTGEERIVPPNARYYVCTVEAMPVSKARSSWPSTRSSSPAISSAATSSPTASSTRPRPHETLLLGAATMRPALERLDLNIDGERRAFLAALLCRLEEDHEAAKAFGHRRLLGQKRSTPSPS